MSLLKRLIKKLINTDKSLLPKLNSLTIPSWNRKADFIPQKKHKIRIKSVEKNRTGIRGKGIKELYKKKLKDSLIILGVFFLSIKLAK